MTEEAAFTCVVLAFTLIETVLSMCMAAALLQRSVARRVAINRDAKLIMLLFLLSGISMLWSMQPWPAEHFFRIYEKQMQAMIPKLGTSPVDHVEFAGTPIGPWQIAKIRRFSDRTGFIFKSYSLLDDSTPIEFEICDPGHELDDPLLIPDSTKIAPGQYLVFPAGVFFYTYCGYELNRLLPF